MFFKNITQPHHGSYKYKQKYQNQKEHFTKRNKLVNIKLYNYSFYYLKYFIDLKKINFDSVHDKNYN